MTRYLSFLVLCLTCLIVRGAIGQTTTFTYQGQLTDDGAPASGNFDLQFALFDGAASTTQIGSPLTVPAVLVQNGIFTVQLDFGAVAFPGANRFLEIGVRRVGGGSFTTLAPRQQISATPYAIRTLSAATADALSSACVGCVQDTQIAAIAGSKVSGAIPAASIPSGSGNYVQNTTTQQAASNFNISGNGTIGGNLTVMGALNANLGGSFIRNQTSQQSNASFNITGDGLVGGTLSANHVDTPIQYSISGQPVLSAQADDLFVGFGAGGQVNTGPADIVGDGNSFFGFNAGYFNTGHGNAFFGEGTGATNAGNANAFFGTAAGATNAAGSYNAFFGSGAGTGDQPGLGNKSGSYNTVVGSLATLGADNLTNATAIGANAQVDQSNALVLGSIAGTNGAAASVNVGIGTRAPEHRLHVDGGSDDAIFSTSTDGRGVRGHSDSNNGIYGESGNSNAVYGQAHDSISAGVFGINDNANGGTGVRGFSGSGRGVWGGSTADAGVYGDSVSGIGVYGSSGAPNTLVNAGVVGVSTGFNGIGVRGVADNGTNTWAVYGHSTSGYAGYFDGKVQVNGTFINNSDARLKTKIADLSYGLSAVMRLRPVTWKWKKDPNGRPQLGLVAQEVEPVLPELVEPGADKDRLLGMNYIGLVPVVIKAIQEQQSTIIKLERENAALEARVAELERVGRSASTRCRGDVSADGATSPLAITKMPGRW